MSDIPVGSPPAPPGRHAAPGGWYPDPLDRSRERYWDGWQWSRNTRAAERPPQAPAPQPVGAPGAYAALPATGYGVRSTGVSRQAATTADGVPLAGWWWRALAGLVDAVLVGVVTGLLSLPFYTELVRAVGAYWSETFRAAQAGSTTPPPTPNFAAMLSGTDQLLLVLIGLAVGLAYHLPLLRLRGATVGMLACGLRVVRLDEGRASGPLEWPRVLTRTLIWVLPGALGVFPFTLLTVADVLLPLWHPKRQTLHDLAARTQVVRLR